MNQYRNAIDKLLAQVESHINRLEDSERDNTDKIDALQGFRDALEGAIDDLDAEWPQ